jgi:phosphopantetheine adenylyltransferase
VIRNQKKENKLKMNERNNYYYKKEFYFNVTKNKDIQQFEVPEELDKIINEIIVNKDTDDKHLLLNNEKKEYSTSSLSIFIMRTFNKIYGISISAVEIRRLYSTYLKEEAKNGNITEEEHRIICEKMNHSYEENKKYAYL